MFMTIFAPVMILFLNQDVCMKIKMLLKCCYKVSLLGNCRSYIMFMSYNYLNVQELANSSLTR